jgi:hypothetical protein
MFRILATGEAHYEAILEKTRGPTLPLNIKGLTTVGWETILGGVGDPCDIGA